MNFQISQGSVATDMW